MEMVKATRNFARNLLSKFRSPLLYKSCRFYINTYNNDMDCYFYTNGEYALAKQVIPHCKTIFDVGANVGNWSKMVCDINHQQQHIKLHAFEPSKERFQLLCEKKLQINANNFALSDKNEIGELFYDVFGGSNSLYQSIENDDHRKEIIKLFTLDHYCQENQVSNIDYLKIDVEGHELKVLKGASHMLSQGKIALVQFEYGPNYIDANCLLKHIFEYIKDTHHGYEFYKLLQNKLHPVPKYQYIYENFLNSTWVIHLKNHPAMIRNFVESS